MKRTVPTALHLLLSICRKIGHNCSFNCIMIFHCVTVSCRHQLAAPRINHFTEIRNVLIQCGRIFQLNTRESILYERTCPGRKLSMKSFTDPNKDGRDKPSNSNLKSKLPMKGLYFWGLGSKLVLHKKFHWGGVLNHSSVTTEALLL